MALKKLLFVSVLVSLLVMIVLLVFFFHGSTAKNMITQVHIGSTTISVEVADTESTREQGLSGRASLSEGKGMLFVFEQSGKWGFWMKDMNFAIDMIFFDQSGMIVTIDSDVSPDTYHQNPPQVFYPSAPVLYVLEVPAGFAKAHSIAVGSKIVVQ